MKEKEIIQEEQKEDSTEASLTPEDLEGFSFFFKKEEMPEYE